MVHVYMYCKIMYSVKVFRGCAGVYLWYKLHDRAPRVQVPKYLGKTTITIGYMETPNTLHLGTLVPWGRVLCNSPQVRRHFERWQRRQEPRQLYMQVSPELLPKPKRLKHRQHLLRALKSAKRIPLRYLDLNEQAHSHRSQVYSPRFSQPSSFMMGGSFERGWLRILVSALETPVKTSTRDR